MKESNALYSLTFLNNVTKDKSMYLLQAEMGTLQDSD